MHKPSRRELFIATATSTAFLIEPTVLAQPPVVKEQFKYSLNTSTLMGHKLPITKIIEIASKAGYNAIEPWIREIDDYVKGGGSLPDLKKKIADAGLTVESAIGFFDWIVDDSDRRKTALTEAARNMELLQKIGGLRLAAPPSGATDRADLNLYAAADRYRDLLLLGDKYGVVPQAEIWGFSKCLNRLGPAMFIALECGHPKACILPDVFHLYKGGSNFDAIKLLNGNDFHNFHMNDYPSSPGRDTITDADRVFPGDGTAQMTQLFKDLRTIGYKGALSIELFNREYWKQDPQAVATIGLSKLKSLVQKSLG